MFLEQMPELQTLGLTLNEFGADRPVDCPPRPHPSLQQVSIVFQQWASVYDIIRAVIYFLELGIKQLHLDVWEIWTRRSDFELLWDTFVPLLGSPKDAKVYRSLATATIGEAGVSWSILPSATLAGPRLCLAAGSQAAASSPHLTAVLS